ncbi:MAG: SPOR domain-containing protein [Acidobacteriota bacterium]
MQPYSRGEAPRRTVSNRQVVAIYVGGVLLLLIAFAAGLSVIKKHGVEDPIAPARTGVAKEAQSDQPSSSELQFEVLVAPYGTLARARQVEAELRNRRYYSAHVRMPAGGDTLYRVVIGPYTRADADRVATELSREGLKGLMVVQVR